MSSREVVPSLVKGGGIAKMHAPRSATTWFIALTTSVASSAARYACGPGSAKPPATAIRDSTSCATGSIAPMPTTNVGIPALFASVIAWSAPEPSHARGSDAPRPHSGAPSVISKMADAPGAVSPIR